jgi:hypothetical protein
MPMCRSIKPLFNFEPPATEAELRAASIQFVRKVSGFQRPSRDNAAAFDAAVEEVTAVVQRLVGELHAHAAPKNREIEAAKARARRERAA